MGENGKYYRFGEFRFDPWRLELEFSGDPVSLPPKSLEALKILLDRHGEVVEREFLVEMLWNESFVEEANLTVTVSRLRKALGDRVPEETFIQTLPRVGYRFVANVEVSDAVSGGELDSAPSSQLPLETRTPGVGSFYSHSRLLLAFAAVLVIALVSLAWLTRQTPVAVAEPSRAEQAFGKGEVEFRKRKPCDSIPYFLEATERNQQFALAFARLAAAQAMCPAQDGARANLAKALALDPNLADAHAIDGFIRMGRDWDWPGAERSLRRAIELDHNLPEAHHWLGVYLSIHRRLGEAKGEMQRAVNIEPDSPLFRADLCQIYYFMREYGAAEIECRKSLEIDPTFFFAHNYLQDIYLQLGNETAAVETKIAAQETSEAGSELVAKLRETFARGGFRGFWQGQLNERLSSWPADSAVPDRRAGACLSIASLYTSLGDRENALRWLNDAVTSNQGAPPFRLVYLGVDPRYDFLRDDPRFGQMLNRLGLDR
ncbi:MAG: winged helix-turn-helix domain-containing protein [Pyrinomonadaceae bacterium]